MKQLFVMAHSEARRRAMAAVAEAPEGWRVTVEPPKRSGDQNALFHALCTDIAKQAEWAGKKRSAEAWKVLLVSGHSVATKQGAEILPGLEGEFVNLRESTAAMSKARGASLIEYTLSYCAENGISVGLETA